MTTTEVPWPLMAAHQLDEMVRTFRVQPIGNSYDFAPAASADLDPRMAAVLILHSTEWDLFMQREFTIECLAASALLNGLRWNTTRLKPGLRYDGAFWDARPLMNSLTAWVTSRLRVCSLCLDCLEESDGDPIPYNDCDSADDHETGRRFDRVLWESPDEIRRSVAGLVKAEIAREQRSTS